MEAGIRELEIRELERKKKRAELECQDILCHLWFAAEELGEVVN
jgi:hypothetical protein